MSRRRRNGKRSDKLHRKRSSKERRRKKQAAYERHNGQCAYCGDAFSMGEMTIDHIMPLSKGGSWKNENITIACSPCNRDKGDKTLAEHGARRIHRK